MNKTQYEETATFDKLLMMAETDPAIKEHFGIGLSFVLIYNACMYFKKCWKLENFAYTQIQVCDRQKTSANLKFVEVQKKYIILANIYNWKTADRVEQGFS